jgi:hemolysin activation/secretion protein
MKPNHTYNVPRRVVLGILVSGISFAASAQAPPPSVVPNAGQIERQFVPEPQPRATTGAIVVPETAEGAAPSTDEVKFVLRQIDIVGAESISAAELAGFHQPLIGQQIGLSDLHALARRITAHYRNTGYLLSQALVPAQNIEDGKARIQVIEGYVAEFEIRGVAATEYPLIATYAKKVLATRPIDAVTLERYLLLMNDLAGITVRGTLAPAKDKSGASTLLLDVSVQRISGGATVDNRSGNSLGPWRTMLDAQANSLLTANDRTTLRAITSWDQKLNYFAFGHEQTFGREGGKIGLTLGVVRSQPIERFFIALNQESESDSLVLNYSYPVIRSRAQNLSVRASLGSHDGKTKIFNVVETEDHIRSARLGFTWDYADALGGVNLADVEYSQGIDGLGASRNGDPTLSRALGRVDYRKLNAYLARVQTLSARWSILAAVSAQQAYTDLLSSELFSLGGDQFGRGFDPSELVGDHGIASKLELRYGVRQPIAGIAGFMLYGFRDFGQVRQKTPQPGSDARESLSSWGFGLRLHVSPTFTGFVEWAQPRQRDVATEGDRSARVFGGVSARF